MHATAPSVIRRFGFVILCAAVALGIAYALLLVQQRSFRTVASAQSSYHAYFSGYAWSETVGWISFNGTNYGVTLGVDDTTLDGYAWSENIGWISFTQSDLSGCPSGTCSARLASGAMSGWARAIAAVGRTDGWDGWISLSGSSPAYGPQLSGGVNADGAFTGYAWGSTVVGWMDFSTSGANTNGVRITYTYIPPPSLPILHSFVAGRAKQGEPATLRWNIANMASGIDCSIAPAPASQPVWNGSSNPWVDSVETQPITAATLFTLSCGNGVATTSLSATVNLIPVFQEI